MAVFVRKMAMEDAGVGVENQRQKIAVSLPHRQEMQLCNGVPGEHPFFILREGCAVEAVDPEDKAQPVLPLRAEAGPVDGAAQQDLLAVDPCFFLDFPGEAGKNILVWPHFAAKPVVLTQVGVARTGIAMDKKGLGPVWRDNVAKGADDGGVGHDVRPVVGKSPEVENIFVSFKIRHDSIP